MKREVGEYQPRAGITSARMLGRPVVPSSVVAAKRSPILGYNHNVRYRGLVFHVQTEDSGVLSPHLFTHLFHGGVIVSTRKLVYDSGSAEDAIKALMQAQHKAVLKDLKKGAFDDKIDQYLGGTPGLLPRGEGGTEAPQTATMEPLPKPAASSQDDIAIPTAPTIDGFDSAPFAALSTGVPEAVQGALTIPSAPPVMAQDSTPNAVPSRTRTAERTSGPVRAVTPIPVLPRTGATPPAGVPTARVAPSGQVPVTRATPPAIAVPSMPPPPPPDLDTPTYIDHAAAVAAALDNAKTRHDLGPPMPADFAEIQSSPEIEMTLEVDDDDDNRAHPRAHRDTEVSAPTPMPSASQSLSDGVPRGRQESAPPLPPTPDRRVAAALPPGKSVTRPPAVAVVSRPLTNTDSSTRERHDSDSIEVYAPPPTPELGVPNDRPGQYSLRRSKPVGVPEPIRDTRAERSGGVAVPAGLGRPTNRSDRIRVVTPPAVEIAQPPSRPTPLPTPSAASQSRPFGVKPEIPAAPLRAPRTAPDSEPRARSPQPTPARVPPSAPPSAARTSTASPVVMTRPAVIVGAPAKQTGKVRKAREDEGRGFGQGLISEKSLDEVILAYLSEDAEEK
jgi:hypothetical protein